MAKKATTTNKNETKRLSQKEAMKDLVADGQPRTIEELRSEVESATGRAAAVNSIKVTISALRKEGVKIECDRSGDVSVYKAPKTKRARRKKATTK